MKKQLFATLPFLLIWNHLLCQDLTLPEVPFQEVIKCMTDTNAFFQGLTRTIGFPRICAEHKAAEYVEMKLNWDGHELQIDNNALNPHFKKELEGLYSTIAPLIKDCKAFASTFYIHFDFEPWSYPNKVDQPTNNGILYNHNTHVVRGYDRPFIQSGG